MGGRVGIEVESIKQNWREVNASFRGWRMDAKGLGGRRPMCSAGMEKIS